MLGLKVLGRLGAALALALVVGMPGALAEPLPIESLSKLPAISNVTLSRDGDYVVALIAPPGEDKADKPSLAVWDANDMTRAPAIASSDGDTEFIYAAALKAGKILVVARKPWTGRLAGCGEGKAIGSTRTYLQQVFITDTSFSRFDEPFSAPVNTRGMSKATQRCLEIAGTSSLRSLLALDDENVLIDRLDTDTFNTEVLRYNLRTGDSEIVHRDVRGTPRADLFDARTGALLTKTDIAVSDGKYTFKTYIVDPASGVFVEHPALESNSDERFEIAILGRDEASGKYYVRTDQFSDKDEIYMYDAAAQAYDAEALWSNPDFDAVDVVLGQLPGDYNRLLGIAYLGASTRIDWRDSELQAIAAAFEAQLPGRSISVLGYDTDRSKIILEAGGSAFAPAYYLLEGKTKTSLIGSQRPWIDGNALSRAQLVHYTARDGMRIPAFLTAPQGWREGDPPAPAIVMPHGGPWARDSDDWDAAGWTQFLSTRGFAVLQPQFRGSTGWGRALWLAGDAEWGQKMQDDKDDGAAWMAAQGIAQADNIAIFGYSYGGFAAFAAVVRENGPFKCAVGGAGLSDLARIGSSWSDNRLQRVMQGRTLKGMDPMLNTERANIPVLVFHGDRDVRVPLFHGEKFYKAVRTKIDADYLEIKDMPHSLPWTPAMQTQTLGAVERFLFGTCGMPRRD